MDLPLAETPEIRRLRIEQPIVEDIVEGILRWLAGRDVMSGDVTLSRLKRNDHRG
jgi:hypothetical protein